VLTLLYRRLISPLTLFGREIATDI
jgi:hypothetical protein